MDGKRSIILIFHSSDMVLPLVAGSGRWVALRRRYFDDFFFVLLWCRTERSRLVQMLYRIGKGKVEGCLCGLTSRSFIDGVGSDSVIEGGNDELHIHLLLFVW